MDLARAILLALENCPFNGSWHNIEIAGPGFVNLFLSPKAHQAVVGTVLDEGERFGRKPAWAGDDAKVMVEFVSANPTGPLHVGHGRQGALAKKPLTPPPLARTRGCPSPSRSARRIPAAAATRAPAAAQPHYRNRSTKPAPPRL